MYREAYGNDDTSALNFSVQGRTLNSGILGGLQLFSMQLIYVEKLHVDIYV